MTALEVLSLFSATAEKEGETSAIMSTLSSLRKFRDWWELNTVTHKTVALRKKLKNISLTEGFPSARVCFNNKENRLSLFLSNFN